jgi:iron complex transport system substrate-binding protein
MRVVTLLPSATEIVYALGIEPRAVSHECDYPPAVRSKPSVNRSRVDETATSSEIDRQVLQAERDGSGVDDDDSSGVDDDDSSGVYEIDLAVLRETDPDLIITQGLCDVCAVDQVLIEDAVNKLDLDCEILTTDPHSIDDILGDIKRIGRATGTETRAEELIRELRARIDTVRTATPTDNRQVVVLDWMDPLMTAGHWVPEMISIAGGSAPFDDTASVPREWDEIVAVDPDVLVVAPCGFDLDQTEANLTDLTERDGWNNLTAVTTGRTYALDGHQYMNRPGVRIVDSLEHLAGLIHPETFESPPEDAARPLCGTDERVR